LSPGLLAEGRKQVAFTRERVTAFSRDALGRPSEGGHAESNFRYTQVMN